MKKPNVLAHKSLLVPSSPRQSALPKYSSQVGWTVPGTELNCSGLNDVNKSFSVFYNKLNKLLNKHAPFKPISKRKKKRLLKPWVTKGIRKSIKIKNDLYCSGDTASYKLYRNKVLMLTRISKKMYFHKYFEENFTNTKKCGRASTAF